MSNVVPSSNVVLWFVVALTLLLVTFIYEVLRTPLDPVRPSETPAAPAPPPQIPAAVPRLPRRQPPDAVPSGAGGPYGDPGYPPGYGSPARPPEARPRVSGGPPWGPAPRPPGL